MKIIISPAKKMNCNTDEFDYETIPQFLPQTKEILKMMQKMSDAELQRIWKCNDAIAKVNIERIRTMDLEKNLTPAILAYEGIQYQYMAAHVFEAAQLAYVRENLCILSGFYGIVRPFDGVVPYRLEMQAALSVGGQKNLYGFWGKQLADALTKENDCILNLASKEYSKAVLPHIPPEIQVVDCVFCENIAGKLKERATFCKMARGQMVRYLAEINAQSAAAAKGFSQLGYRFHAEHSTDNRYVFIKEVE